MYDVNPLTALIYGLGVLIILFYMFLPKKGLIARWKINTLNSVAGNLSISADEAANITQELKWKDLKNIHLVKNFYFWN